MREDRSRWVVIPCSFVEISQEIHGSVSLHMHKGMQCYITPLLALELTQAYCWFVLFPPTPLIVFLEAMKKCAIPLSQPLDDNRPRNEMVLRSWCNGGPRGYRHTSSSLHFLLCSGLVGFYALSTLADYLMVNTVYTYILNIGMASE